MYRMLGSLELDSVYINLDLKVIQCTSNDLFKRTDICFSYAQLQMVTLQKIKIKL